MSLFLLVLETLPGTLAICRLASDAPLPVEAAGGSFFSVTRTPDELSLVCEERVAPANAVCDNGWRALRVVGTLDFALTGVLAALTEPLAEAGISLFAVSTYDTDYILVKEDRLAQAQAALESAGHKVR